MCPDYIVVFQSGFPLWVSQTGPVYTNTPQSDAGVLRMVLPSAGQHAPGARDAVLPAGEKNPGFYTNPTRIVKNDLTVIVRLLQSLQSGSNARL